MFTMAAAGVPTQPETEYSEYAKRGGCTDVCSKPVEEPAEEFPTSAEILISRINFNLKCKNERQKQFIKLIEAKDVVVINGPAGTGKTFIACAEALKLLSIHKSFFKKIIIVKSVTVLDGEEIGFLKGGLKEKMEPFMVSFMDNFHKLIGKELANGLLEADVIEVLPLAYIRGRSIDNAIIIVDEAQNMSKHHLISTVTRIGDNSKMIFLADEDQVDLKNRENSGLTWFLNSVSKLDEFGTMRFEREDIVRNPIITKFLDHLENIEKYGNI